MTARSIDGIASGMGESKRRIFALFSKGLAPSRIARELGMHERYVRRSIVEVWAYDKRAAKAEIAMARLRRSQNKARGGDA